MGFIVGCAVSSFASELSSAGNKLDRIAYAVDGTESSHGTNPAMWRRNPAGPQGPMQVSDKAARDAGGGDRFDMAQNRAIGRAYLALLYRRYGNWPDAVSAYNWGMGNLDSWIRAGRPSLRLVPAVAVYSHRVLAESGLCPGTTGAHRDCLEALLRSNVAPARAAYRNAATVLAVDQLAIPGREQAGGPLARLASSGDPLPNLAQSGQLLPGLEQSGRPLSLARNSRPWRGFRE
jgi:hypothetical protein